MMLFQLPFEIIPLPGWYDAIEIVMNLLYALAARGYLLLILLGFMVYITGLSDGLSKTLVIMGIALFFVGSQIVMMITGSTGIATISIESASATWFNVFGLADSELFAIIRAFASIEVAICVLSGAIMYFTPSSGDLKSRGHSLIVRGLIFAPILAFMYFVPWI
ncbi:MAG: hypothetical protein ACTSUO_08275 [Candidatus Thorarchaeota archaeon]